MDAATAESFVNLYDELVDAGAGSEHFNSHKTLDHGGNSQADVSSQDIYTDCGLEIDYNYGTAGDPVQQSHSHPGEYTEGENEANDMECHADSQQEPQPVPGAELDFVNRHDGNQVGVVSATGEFDTCKVKQEEPSVQGHFAVNASRQDASCHEFDEQCGQSNNQSTPQFGHFSNIMPSACSGEHVYQLGEGVFTDVKQDYNCEPTSEVDRAPRAFSATIFTDARLDQGVCGPEDYVVDCGPPRSQYQMEMGHQHSTTNDSDVHASVSNPGGGSPMLTSSGSSTTMSVANSPTTMHMLQFELNQSSARDPPGLDSAPAALDCGEPIGNDGTSSTASMGIKREPSPQMNDLLFLGGDLEHVLPSGMGVFSPTCDDGAASCQRLDGHVSALQFDGQPVDHAQLAPEVVAMYAKACKPIPTRPRHYHRASAGGRLEHTMAYDHATMMRHHRIAGAQLGPQHLGYGRSIMRHASTGSALMSAVGGRSEKKQDWQRRTPKFLATQEAGSNFGMINMRPTRAWPRSKKNENAKSESNS